MHTHVLGVLEPAGAAATSPSTNAASTPISSVMASAPR